MAQRATSFGPKPSLFFLFFGLLFSVRVFGPKLSSFVSFFGVPFFAFNRKKPCFPTKKGHFLFFYVSLCFSLALFWPPLFHLLFLCLSLFFSFFLPSCFSCQFLVLAFCFCVVCFLFQDIVLFLFFCLLSCFVLNHDIR